LQPEIAKKFTKNSYFCGSRSFKVIDVGTTGKLISSACFDKQQVCVYLALGYYGVEVHPPGGG